MPRGAAWIQENRNKETIDKRTMVMIPPVRKNDILSGELLTGGGLDIFQRRVSREGWYRKTGGEEDGETQM